MVPGSPGRRRLKPDGEFVGVEYLGDLLAGDMSLLVGPLKELVKRSGWDSNGGSAIGVRL